VSAVGRPDQLFSLELGCCIVGKHLFVTPRQATVVVVDGLYRQRRLFLTWPKPQPRASDRHVATRGIDEDAHVQKGAEDDGYHEYKKSEGRSASRERQKRGYLTLGSRDLTKNKIKTHSSLRRVLL
jgi:hypothetical protein